MGKPKWLLVVLGLAAVIGVTLRAAGQEVQIRTSDGKTVVLTPGDAPVAIKAAAIASRKVAESEGDKPKEGEGKPDEKKDDSGKEGGDEPDKEKSKEDDKEKGPEPVVRPSEPPQPPNPEELKIRPDADGKVQFNFTGQPWQDVLQWLADASGVSLDWQELPGDYLNLTTQRSYTLDEARDLINRHLLARGYTLLRHGELLSVAKLKDLSPGMVPRVEAESLDQRDPHEFVKVSFVLDWFLAEMAVEELKPMLGQYGKLNPLKTTNRLEAMDVVVNLLEIRRLLTEEQSVEAQDRLFEEFVLEYAKAEDVREQVLALLGVESKPKAAAPMSPDQVRKMQEAARRAQQQQQQQKGGTPKKAKEAPKVNLVVNARRNSILAQAPPDKMVIIAQAIKALDVPSGMGQSLLVSIHRMQIYRLAAIDPEPLVKTLDSLGELDPKTRLEVDKENRAIIAYATAADHVVIRALVDQLDGSGRRFDVIPLRRLAADYVAGTIEFMMGAGEEKQPKYTRYYYGSSRGGSDEKADKFRVDADVEQNRLLLWANEIEAEEVRTLLVKLGEIPPEGGNASKIRVLKGTWGPETEAWIERVRRAWPSVAPNPIETPEEGSGQSESEGTDTEQAPRPGVPSADVEARGFDPWFPSSSLGTRSASNGPSLGKGSQAGAWEPEQKLFLGRPFVRLTQLRQEKPGETSASTPATNGEESPGAPPIQITRGSDGRVVITSEDTRALDLLEDLMTQLAPPRQDYKIFHLKYAWAFSVALTLEDIFEEDEEDSGRRRGYPFFSYYDYDRGDDDSSRARLSKRRPLKFISDSDSNSILVQGADPAQLAKITELIEFYDQPEPVDSQSVRKMEIFQIRYAKAATIAEAVKDIYRDLLSSNDKALAKAQQSQSAERRYTYVYDSGDGEQQERAPRFKGLLSIGINELSNTLAVSAPQHFLEDVGELIEQLDEAARPTVEVVEMKQVAKGVDLEEVRQKLLKVLGEGRSGRQPGQAPPGAKSKRPDGRSPQRLNGAPAR